LKNLWIINHHALTPDMSGGTRHYDFAKELVQRGYKVTIIASSFHYSKLKEMKNYEHDKNYLQENIDGIDFIWLKTPSYKGNGFSRVKNMLSFMFALINVVPKLNLSRPETIIGSSVHLFAVYGAYILSKKYKSRFIMEVRDLWPQTLIDMGISSWHPFILLLGYLERFLYKKADKIITTLPKANLYIQRYVPLDKIVWISNGTEISNTKLQYKKKFDESKFNVVYTGTHGLANNLNILIDVANLLKDNKKIFFTLIGDGVLKDDLRKRAEKLNLNNINFIDSVPKADIFDYLKSADLLYVGLKDSPLYRYGMSMNKVFDYMSAKKPILFVSSIENNIIELSNGGKVIKYDDKIQISKAIEEFSLMTKKSLNIFGNNNFEYLSKNYTIEILVNKLEKLL